MIFEKFQNFLNFYEFYEKCQIFFVKFRIFLDQLFYIFWKISILTRSPFENCYDFLKIFIFFENIQNFCKISIFEKNVFFLFKLLRIL